MNKIPLIDTHTHLCDPIYDNDRQEVIRRAHQSGVETIVTVGENYHDALKNLELSRQYTELKPGFGLYPTYLDHDQADSLIRLIREYCEKCYCIGEVGLDYWKIQKTEEREIQKELFCLFIRLANQLDLPLNIHSRSAGKYAIKLLLKESAKRVQMHAFDGKPSTALPAVEEGYFFSIPASIVTSSQKQKLVKRLPLSCLLIETDSPVLGPVKGERNEPANVSIVIQVIARIKQVSREEVMETVFENTRNLYGKRII